MRQKIEDYLSQRSAEGLSPVSIKDFRERLGKLAKYLEASGVKTWPEVTPRHIDGFLKSIQGYAFNTREGIVACMVCFLRRLAESGSIIGNPARHVDLPRPNQDDLPLPEPPLSEAEIALVFEAAPRRSVPDLRNIAFLEVLYSAGLRLSEALALDLRDLDLQKGVLVVRRGKGNKSREIPIMRGLQGALRDYLSLRRSLLRGPDEGALFLDRVGRRWKTASAQQFFKSLNRRLKGKVRHVHAHLFRHSIAVHLVRGGADIRFVQAFLGHESLDTTKIYLRLVPADLRKAYDMAMPDVAIEA